MNESPPSLGMPARLLGEEVVLRAIIDAMERLMPGAKHIVFDSAHQRLSLKGPKVSSERDFFRQAHAAVDEIMQASIEFERSALRAAKTQKHVRDQILAETALVELALSEDRAAGVEEIEARRPPSDAADLRQAAE